MRQEQLLRFVQQISFLLKLSQPCSRTALQFFLQFKQYQTKYNHEILIGSSIYLAAKVFQQEAKIRDILNMVYVITSLYRISAENSQNQQESSNHHDKIHNQNQQQYQQPKQESEEPNLSKEENKSEPYIKILPKYLKKYIKKFSQSHKNSSQQYQYQETIQPKYSLSDYNEYKGKIIQAEQYLLRIVGFNFESFQKNKKELTKLLVLLHQMRMPILICQNVIRLYNDLQYVSIQCWLEGIIYFGYLLTKIGLKLAKSQNWQSQQQSDKSYLNSFNVNDVQMYVVSDQQFGQLFCTSVKSLKKYCQKLVLFYQSLQVTPQKKQHKMNKQNKVLFVNQQNQISQKQKQNSQHVLLQEGCNYIGHPRHQINNAGQQCQKQHMNLFQMQLQMIMPQKQQMQMQVQKQQSKQNDESYPSPQQQQQKGNQND